MPTKEKETAVNASLLEAALIGFEQMKKDVEQKMAAIRKRLGVQPSAGTSDGRARRTLSASARRRIAAAQRKRWALLKAKQAKPKRGMSAAGRRRIAAAQRKRWALLKAKKAGTPVRAETPKKMAAAS